MMMTGPSPNVSTFSVDFLVGKHILISVLYMDTNFSEDILSLAARSANSWVRIEE